MSGITILRPLGPSGPRKPELSPRVPVQYELSSTPRLEVFQRMLAGRAVLHVGYADWPILSIEDHLHVQLDGVCKTLDGVDPHEDAARRLRPYVRGALYTSLDEVRRSYDVLLVPEVLQYVGDVAGFLAALDRIEFDQVLLSAPSAWAESAAYHSYCSASYPAGSYGLHERGWATPFTLADLVASSTPWWIESVWQVHSTSLLLIGRKRPPTGPKSVAA